MRAFATVFPGGRFAAGRAGGLLRSAALAGFVLLAGCATAPDRAAQGGGDPLEGMNRAIFAFNDGFDQAVIRPAAYVYKGVVPEPLRDAVRNFLRWLRSPVILANDLLQGDLEHAGVTAARFAVNGLTLGLADMAEDLGLPHRDEDFGQTLGAHGAGEGFYLVLPFLGPSSLRDAAGIAVDAFIDPLNRIGSGEADWRLAAGRRGAEGLDFRARYYEEVDDLRNTSLDYYARVRSIYTQQRRAAIHNGAPPLDETLPDLSREFDAPAFGGESARNEAAPPDDGTPAEEAVAAAKPEPEGAAEEASETEAPRETETAAAPPAAGAGEEASPAVETEVARAEAEAEDAAPADTRVAAAPPAAAEEKPAAAPARTRGVHLASYRSRAAAMRGWRVLSGKYPDDLGPYEPAAIRTDTGVGRYTRLYAAVGAPEPALSRLRDRIRAGGDYAAILAVPADEAGGIWR